MADRAGIRFMLERPIAWSTDQHVLRVTGWCFANDVAVAGIVTIVAGRSTILKIGIARPDVAKAYPGVPNAQLCGFDGTIDVVAGDHPIELHAQLESEDTVVLIRETLEVRAASLHANIETPADGVTAGTIRFSGWCFHPERTIAALFLRVGDRRFGCAQGLLRADVAAAYPSCLDAGNSGFEVAIELPSGSHAISLEAELSSGENVASACSRALRVVPQSLRVRVRRSLRNRHSAWLNVLTGARHWVRTRGRLPMPSEWPRLARKSWRVFAKSHSLDISALPGGFVVPATQDRYTAWLEMNMWNSGREQWLRRRLSMDVAAPLISIVMPVYRPDHRLLARAIETVVAQVHDRWELCIADDASDDAELRSWLEARTRGDQRIKVTFRNQNGNISRATNSAAALASGEFLLFLDQDDELSPDALGEIVLKLAGDPNTDLLYTDDDKIDPEGRRYDPQFKPDWSPELLLSYMYVSHALVVRRSLFNELRGFRSEFDGSQDYDFALRATERARTVVHVPMVLYHWRATAHSTAFSGMAKPASFAAGERAVCEALARRGSSGVAIRPAWAKAAGVGIFVHVFPDNGPRVAILVPTRNNVDMLRRCIESVRRTTYRNHEVVIIDNASDDERTLQYLQQVRHRVLRIPNPERCFSFANINNEAVRGVDADYVLFLNDDTEVREPAWLSQMVGYALLPGVGAVGARLLYEDNRIQHAGVVLGYYDGLAGPAFRLAPATDHGYLSYATVTRNYSAVTAACMLTPRSLFLDVGGFDDERFAVTFNDVDYCLRLGGRGLRCVYAACAELTHREGHSRGFADDPREIATFRKVHETLYDPFYSPHLSLANEHFAIQPRRVLAGTRPHPIRALTCTVNLNWEGAPQSQFELVRALRDRGIIDPIVFSPLDGPLRAAYEDANIPIHVARHPLTGAYAAAEYDAAIDRFAAWIADQGVSVVYGNTLNTFYAIDAAERLGLPSIWNPRESEPWQEYFRQFPEPVAARALGCFAKPYRVIFVAHATAARFAELDTRHNFAVIHNGIDTSRLREKVAGIERGEARQALGISPEEIMVLAVGTVCERKGQHDLVRALALLPDSIVSRLRVFIVGDRPSVYSRALHALVAVQTVATRSRVSVVAETNATGLYFRAADLFVCTSLIESYPRVTLEAMAFGLPIISTPVFGIREQIRDGVNGLFYEPGDVATLARQLTELVTNETMRARLGANAYPSLEALTDFNSMTSRYAEVFAEAAAP